MTSGVEREHLSLLQQNAFLEIPVDIFGEESSKEPEIMFGDGLPTKLFEPCTER